MAATHASPQVPSKLLALITKGSVYALLMVIALLCLVPFYSMLIASTHDSNAISTQLLLLPSDQFKVNYDQLIAIVNIWWGFLNSLYITVTSVVLALYFSALAAYGFAKFPFRFRNFLFGFVLATMMIPGQLGIIGFFKFMGALDLLNTYWPLILPSVANAFAIFFLRQICDSSVPEELLEAARLDGAGEFAIFHRMVLPLLGPSIAALAIFLFISKWNSFLEPLIIIFTDEKQTLPVMVALTQGQFRTDYGAQYVGIVVSVIPIVVIFALASRRIISGVTVGALKG